MDSLQHGENQLKWASLRDSCMAHTPRVAKEFPSLIPLILDPNYAFNIWQNHSTVPWDYWVACRFALFNS